MTKEAHLFSTVVLFVAMSAIPVKAATYTYVGTAANYSAVTAGDITNAVNWSSGETPSSGNTYAISNRSKTQYCGLGIPGTFPGCLRLESPWSQLIVWGTCTYTFAEGLELAGANIWVKNYGSTFTIAGDVTVSNENAEYSVLSGMFNANPTLIFTGAFHGSSKACFTVRQESRTDSLNFVAKFKGDMSDYAGTIRVGGGEKTPATVLFGDTAVGGKVLVGKSGSVAPCAAGTNLGRFSVGTLQLDAMSTVRVAVSAMTNGSIRVIDRLILPTSGNVNLTVASYDPAVTAYGKYPLLVVPAGTGLSKDRFNLNLPSAFTAYYKTVAANLLVEENAETETLYLHVRKTVTMAKTDAVNQSCFLPQYADHWSGLGVGTVLDPETSYFCSSDSYDVRSSNTGSGAACVFGGWGLTICRYGKLYVYDSIRVNRLYLYPYVSFCHADGPERFVEGVIYAIDPLGDNAPSSICGRKNKTFDIRAEIRGGGAVRFTTIGNLFDYGNTTFKLSGTNTAFSGKVDITNQKAEYATEVRLSDGRSLGGAMAAATYNGVTVRGNSRVTVQASTTFAEPTRGWHVLGRANVTVANAADEVRLLSPLTMSGTLVKGGPGTLALGGTCRFTAEQSGTPLAGTNVLTVANGWVKPLSTNAFDGLSISFAAGTGVALPLPGAVSPDVATYGLVDVKWATPFDLTACGGRLNVRLDGVETLQTDDDIAIAICTVPSSAAETLRGNIAFGRVPHHRVAIRERVNADTSVTFVADVKPTGLSVILR